MKFGKRYSTPVAARRNGIELSHSPQLQASSKNSIIRERPPRPTDGGRGMGERGHLRGRWMGGAKWGGGAGPLRGISGAASQYRDKLNMYGAPGSDGGPAAEPPAQRGRCPTAAVFHLATVSSRRATALFPYSASDPIQA